MYKTGDNVKVPILIVEDGATVSKGYAMGIVIRQSQTVEDATEIAVNLKEGTRLVNIKNTDLDELNA